MMGITSGRIRGSSVSFWIRLALLGAIFAAALQGESYIQEDPENSVSTLQKFNLNKPGYIPIGDPPVF